MDPLSALIGGGFSMLGGLFGSEATTAANQANIQQAQWQATGGYLPGLIANAKRAGINPLAVLPGGGGSANIQPVSAVGSALGDIGQNLSRMKLMTTPEDPHERTMKELQERSGRAQVQHEENQLVVDRHNINNLTGSPNLGGANAKFSHPVGDALRAATGVDHPNFLLDIPAQIGDVGYNATRAAGRAMSDWISRWGLGSGGY